MRKRLLLILLCLFVLSFNVIAQEEDFTKYNSLNLKININANIDLIPSGDNPRADFIISELSLYPVSNGVQKVTNIKYNSEPTAEIKVLDDNIVYKWVKPTTSIFFEYESDVKTLNNIPRISEKISFPLRNLDASYVKYTEPTENIDINSEIRNKANELVSGEDDYYLALFKISNWVRDNIEYNLSTVTAEAVQKSSWVYENREGVCDEITNLFISMARAVGIPARFISGVAYTTLAESSWGNHGWAEVYFPGYGWIPFDVTYGQYGFIDPSHISLKESLDSAVASLTISSSASNLDFNAKGLNIDTTLISKEGLNPELIRTRLELLENQVGPGSHVPVRISLENPQDFYVPIQFRVTKAPMLDESNLKMVLLRPKEIKDIFFLVKIPENIDKNYIYKTVFEVVDSFGSTFTDQITYSDNFEIISESDAKRKIEEYNKKQENSYSEELELSCKPEKDYYFDYEDKANLICTIKNLGNIVMNDVSVCIGDNCDKVSLYISESKEVKFTDLDIGSEIEVLGRTGNSVVSKFLKIKSLSNPDLRIQNLEYPSVINYKDLTEIKFLMISDTPANNLRLYLNGKQVSVKESFDKEEEIILETNGKNFYSSDNFANLSIKYEDENGYEYEASKVFLVDFKNVPLFRRLLALFGI